MESRTERLRVADTAVMTALARMAESSRVDSLFDDPFASWFVGAASVSQERLEMMLGAGGDVITVRTLMIDQLLSELVTSQSAVLNLGAGFDARRYRLDLPHDAVWIEVDLPETMARNEVTLSVVEPVVQVRRYGLDLADENWFEELLELEPDLSNIVAVAEGLFTYMDAPSLRALAERLYESGRCHYLLGDVVSPITARQLRSSVEAAGGSVDFHVLTDLEVFEACGWRCTDYRLTVASLRQHRPGSPMAQALAMTARGESRLLDGVVVLWDGR